VKRRDFIGVIYGGALALPLAAAAQQPEKVWRIGEVFPLTPEVGGRYAQVLEQGLADLGYVQGRNIVLLPRFTGPQSDKIEEAIISLVPQVDLLVVGGNAGMPAKKLAGSVPTVFVSIGFPVETGLVQSLAHPSGNMTGIECRSRVRDKREATADSERNRTGPQPSGCPSRFR
jgi:putative tryptophan/tyrosine transport system substrate-binding protein